MSRVAGTVVAGRARRDAAREQSSRRVLRQRPVRERAVSPGEGRAAMTTRIIITTAVAFAIAINPLIGPRDVFSQLLSGVIIVFLCFVPLFVLSRFHFMKSAAGSVQTLVCVLICMLALLSLMCFVMGNRIASLHDRLDSYTNTPSVESSADTPEEQSQSRADEFSRITSRFRGKRGQLSTLHTM